MPAIPTVLSLNGQQFSWNSTVSKVDGIPMGGVTSVNWGEELDVETVYAQTQDGKPIGGTAGQYSVPNFQIKVLRDWEDAWTDYLAAKPPFVGTIGRSEFSYQLIVSEPLLGKKPIIVVAETCRIVGIDNEQAKGAAVLETTFKIWTDEIVKNGKSLYVGPFPGVPT